MQYDLSFPKPCCHPLFHCKCPRARSHLGKHFHSTSALFRSKQRSVECSQHQEPQLESEVNQVTSELNTVSQSLALALARPAASSSLGAAPQAPKLSKIFADPRTCMIVPGVRNLKSGGHTFACGKMRILPLSQGQPVSALCCPEW